MFAGQKIQVPDECYCPITGDLMSNPVMDKEGISAEKDEYEKWVRTSGNSLSRTPLQVSDLRPNIGLKNLIEQLRPFIKKEQMKKIIDTTKLMEMNNLNKKLNIIMCIDNSGSMDNEAIAKDIHGNTESIGSTILDLVVQSCKMFISNLEDGNIITIITYSNNATILVDTTIINENNKKNTFKVLDTLRTGGITNMWKGMTKAFEIANNSYVDTHETSILLFTDGIPSDTPSRGYEGALKQYFRENSDVKNVPIHTFGFGYSLKSDILDSISHFSKGIYAFIPDPSMICDIFSNFIAYLLNNSQIDFSGETEFNVMREEFVKLIYVLYKEMNINTSQSYDKSVINLQSFIDKWSINDNPYIQELLKDANGEVLTSLKIDAFNNWGKHYLLSLANAHTYCMCNNFKDPGVQIYANDRFETLRDEAEKTFATIPCNQSRKGRIEQRSDGSQVWSTPSQVLSPVYSNHTQGVCFDGDCELLLKNNETVLVKEAKPGMIVKTEQGNDVIEAILVSKMSENKCSMVQLESGWKGTPNHPIKINGIWIHPKAIGKIQLFDCNAVYSFLLKNRHSSIFINGIESITLAHDLHGEIEEHDFYGSEVVVEAMKTFDSWNKSKIIEIQSSQIRRDSKSGFVIGFKE